jgi:hypothetical protein
LAQAKGDEVPDASELRSISLKKLAHTEKLLQNNHCFIIYEG